MVSCPLPVLLGPETENVSASPRFAFSNLLPYIAVTLCLVVGLRSQPGPSPDSAMEKMKLHQDYLGALAELEELLKAPNPSPVIYYLAGVCQTSLRNYPEAVGNFRRALDRGLDSWELRLSLGVAYLRMGRDPDARRELELVLQLRPEEPTALFHLGELDLKEGRYPAAERNFRQVLRLNPGHENILFNLGTSLLRQGKEAEGRAVLKNHRHRAHLRGRLKTLRWMSASPRASAEVFADLGDANLEIGDERAALDAYARAERLAPNTHLTGFGRGKLSFRRGNLHDAGTQLRRYLNQGGRHCEAFLLMALVERRTQRHREAWGRRRKGIERLSPRRGPARHRGASRDGTGQPGTDRRPGPADHAGRSHGPFRPLHQRALSRLPAKAGRGRTPGPEGAGAERSGPQAPSTPGTDLPVQRSLR